MAYKRSYSFDRPWKDVMEELADDDVHEEFYHSRNPLVAYLHNRRLGIIRDLIRMQRARDVLEIGCGDGYVLEALSGEAVSLTGIEISEKRVARARKLAPSATVVQGDACELPFDTNSVDVCVCTEVLEHIPGPEQAVLEMKRVLKPGGCVIVTVPNERNWRIGRAALLRFPIAIPDHVNAFTPRTMQRLFEQPAVSMYTLPPLSRWFCLAYVFVFQKGHG